MAIRHAYRKGAHFYISGLRFFYSNIIFASVPFPFDVHAIIFSEDAPALENALHKIFHNKRVNKVNNRKEFFRVSLKENEHVVRESYNKPVEFLKLGTAQEYRETMMIEKEESKIYSSSLLTVS